MARSIRKIEGEEITHYVSERAKRAKPKAKLQPPMVPMIDVTFQLLIYFMLTTTFSQAEGQIPGSLPKAGTGGVSLKQELKPPIHIQIRPVGTFKEGVVYEMIGSHGLMKNGQELYGSLIARKERVGAGTPVVIKARSDVRWQYVVEAFNQAVQAEFQNIGFAAN